MGQWYKLANEVISRKQRNFSFVSKLLNCIPTRMVLYVAGARGEAMLFHRVHTPSIFKSLSFYMTGACGHTFQYTSLQQCKFPSRKTETCFSTTHAQATTSSRATISDYTTIPIMEPYPEDIDDLTEASMDGRWFGPIDPEPGALYSLHQHHSQPRHQVRDRSLVTQPGDYGNSSEDQPMGDANVVGATIDFPPHAIPFSSNNEAVRQSSTEENVDIQTFQFSFTSGQVEHSVALSRPAQAKDLGNFSLHDRHLVSAYLHTEQGKKDESVKTWYREISRPYWREVLSFFGNQVPAFMFDRVLNEFCMSNPCIKDPWSGHGLYRQLLVRQQGEPGQVQRLITWMYGTRITPLPSWRDTLSTKPAHDRKVPWIKREKIIALFVILTCSDESAKEQMEAGKKSEPAAHNVKLKRDMLDKAKITYLISNQEHVVADEYWAGFAEELENDRDQNHLYDQVVREKQAAISGNSAKPRLQTQTQEAQGLGEQNHKRKTRSHRRGTHGGQRKIGGSSEVRSEESAGGTIRPPVEDLEPLRSLQYDPQPAGDINQGPKDMIVSLKDQVRQLQGELQGVKASIMNDQPGCPRCNMVDLKRREGLEDQHF
ncbi:hypothetical protein J7T55_002882 [Diaporthe amygdali]|uniref:uncharacterized protein n=1 Tax=Phomopsis amygdali TaxID=1214568 RepID=UPI0022FE0472|nr:uncharacterized protein J7T55_002882 [Diaporthe amygdali]KAJ0122369.1 hypothetical protein J7T55_002882 [Diaporthe amygdali]